jgi:glycosyltransferase involved in cell wall biosynthesis
VNGQTLSVVMPNYNHAQFLRQAVKEVLSQSFSPYEIIIIDDGSTDDSIKVIERIVRENSNIKFLRNDQNQGVVYSANRGLREASGQYIYFAAADDTLFPGFFEDSMRLLAKYPHAGLCSSMVKTIYADGNSIRMPLKNPSLIECYLTPLECLRLLRKHDSWMGGNSCIYRRDVVLECGGFLPELGATCDIFLGMLVALKHGVCFIPKQLAGFRLMPGGYSANFRELKVYSYAANLMKTTYASLFPVDYANSWERRMIYRARISIINQQYKRQITMMEDVVSQKKLVDKFFFLCMKLGIHMQLMVLIFYFLLRLGPDLRIVLQRGLLIKLRYLKERFCLQD